MLGLPSPLPAVAPTVLVHKLVGQGSACAAAQQDGQQGACRQQGSAETRAVQHVHSNQQLPFWRQLAQYLHAGLASFSLLLLRHLVPQETGESDLCTGQLHLKHFEASWTSLICPCCIRQVHMYGVHRAGCAST